MNAEIDSALVSALRQIPELADYHIAPGITDAPLPDLPAVVVNTETVEHVVGGYYKASAKIYIATPATMQDGDWLVRHNLARAAILSAIEGGDLAEDFSSTSVSLRGLHYVSSQQSTEDTRWVWTAELLLGIS